MPKILKYLGMGFAAVLGLSTGIVSAEPMAYLMIGGTPPKSIIVADPELDEAYRVQLISTSPNSPARYQIEALQFKAIEASLHYAGIVARLNLGGESQTQKDENIITFFLQLSRFAKTGEQIEPTDLILSLHELFRSRENIAQQKLRPFYGISSVGFSLAKWGLGFLILDFALLNHVMGGKGLLALLPSPKISAVTALISMIAFSWPYLNHLGSMGAYLYFLKSPRSERGAFIQGFAVSSTLMICGQIVAKLVIPS